MNSIGKVLVVFVTACSLGFLAFALSLVAGGPNWRAEMESDELTRDFTFTIKPGEKVMYSVKNRRTDAAVGGAESPIPAHVVAEARKEQFNQAKKEEEDLSKEIARLTPMIKEWKELIPPDEKAMQDRMKRLDEMLTKISGEVEKVTQEIDAKARAIQEIQKTTQERRDEGFRLKNQLELLRTDIFVNQKQQKILEDELVRVEENLKRLERRNEQLQKQVEPYEK